MNSFIPKQPKHQRERIEAKLDTRLVQRLDEDLWDWKSAKPNIVCDETGRSRGDRRREVNGIRRPQIVLGSKLSRFFCDGFGNRERTDMVRLKQNSPIVLRKPMVPLAEWMHKNFRKS